MSNFVGTPHPPICNGLPWKPYIYPNRLIFVDGLVLHLGVLMNKLAPMKNCPGVHSKLN